MRDRMWDISPTLTKYDHLESVGNAKIAIKALGLEAGRVGKLGSVGGTVGAFRKPIGNFYRTDPVSRNSVTMAKCTVRHHSLLLPSLLLPSSSNEKLITVRNDL